MVQPGAFSVEAGRFADRFAVLGDAFPGVGVEEKSRITGATIRTDTAAVRPAIELALGLLIGSRFRTPSGDRVDGHSVVADAHVGTNAYSVGPATVRALKRVRKRDALHDIAIETESYIASALVRAYASRVLSAILLTLGDLRVRLNTGAFAVRIAGVAKVAIAHGWSDALPVLATLGTLRNAFVAGIEGVAWRAFADTGSDALATGATLRTLRDTAVLLETVARVASANTRSDAFPVRATSRTLGDAFVRRVGNETLITPTDARSDTFTVLASLGTAGNAGFLIGRRICESFATSADSGSDALSVLAAILANGYAFFRFDSCVYLRRRLIDVSRFAFAHMRQDAIAVPTATRAYGLAFAVYFLVAQFTSAHVGRKAVGILLTRLLAVRHADTLLSEPTFGTGADVRRGAFSA